MGDSQKDNFPDINGLFEFDQTPHADQESINCLFLGSKNTADRLHRITSAFGYIVFHHSTSIDKTIDLLLRDIYAIVILEDGFNEIDVVSISRIIRVNHPLARIVVVSRTRRSLKIADFINHGSVDGFIPKPLDEHQVYTMLTEQHAKHDIEKMLTSFVSSPPKMSTASYLLLDPSLSYEEDEPVKFVGIMISHNSVPRYSRFFEDLLKKDEILFAGYLSGISMLGREMLDTKEPLKEINFGGISVIFRFHEDLQFTIFVRNLSKHNVADTEEVISEIVGSLLSTAGNLLATPDPISKVMQEQIHYITNQFKEANQMVQYKREMEKQKTSLEGQLILYYGTDRIEADLIENYLESKLPCMVEATTDHDEANRLLNHPNCAVLIVDSDIETVEDIQHPIDFADFAKDQFPYLQVIYLMRDRRPSTPIINALNRGAINYLLSYRITRKGLCKWVEKATEKAIEIRLKTESVDGVDATLDAAAIAKSMIRANEDSYLTEEIPLLYGIFVAKKETPIFQIFWGDRTKISFDNDMIAGIVASLESVSGEMFHDNSPIGALELGNANIMVQHRNEYNFAFFVENLNSQNSFLINKDLPTYTDRLYQVVKTEEGKLKGDIAQARFDTICNNIYSDFTEKFSEITS